MFRAYALDLNEIYPLIKSYPARSIYDDVKTSAIIETLDGIIRKGEPFLNAQELCELFFPFEGCPVFLSHSGQDKGKVERFAQWLKDKFEINAFIDSDLWGCIRDLQKRIDQTCRIGSKTNVYSYTQRNISTSHVHMMLCHALTQMIDSAECFIFLKSDNSISLENAQKGTFSPWIFHELATVDIIQENRNRDSLPLSVANENFSAVTECIAGVPKVFYPVSMNRPFLLEKVDLENWQNQDFNFGRSLKKMDWYAHKAAKFCNSVGDGTIGATKKWERALNWLYKNCQKKGRQGYV